MQLSGVDDIDAEAIAPLFEESFARVFEGAVENDDFNRLVLRAELSADEIVVLRAYAQGHAANRLCVANVYRNDAGLHPRIARMLVGLFKLRFDPAQPITALPQARSTRSSRRSTKCRIFPKTECSVSI